MTNGQTTEERKAEIERQRAEAMARGKGGAPSSSGGTTSAARPSQQYENRSRLALASPAIRPGMKGRILLAGPSGAGKTYTSLLIAMTLREHDLIDGHPSVVMFDTEKDSGRTYADEFTLADGSPAFMHLPWAAPYNAVDLAMTLRDASGKYDVVIIDSHSHFWRGQGGVLDVASGRWTGWKEARPMQADMVDAILGCDCHVILCARMTQEHTQERNDATGKIEVRKLGMKIQQDDNLEYEVNVALELDMSHVLRVSKSRTRVVPVGHEFIAGHAEEFAGIYREWLRGGEPAASAEQIENLRAALNRITDDADRMRAKQEFLDTFGQPQMLLVSRVPEAAEWIANRLSGNDEPADRAEGEVPPDSTTDEADATRPSDDARASNGTGGQPDRADGQEAAQASPGEVPNTGHCATCGEPVWFDEPDGDWHHAEDTEPGDTHAPTPAPADADPDAILTAYRSARIAASVANEVGAMSPKQVTDELGALGLTTAGTPKAKRDRLVAHRASAATT